MSDTISVSNAQDRALAAMRCLARRIAGDLGVEAAAAELRMSTPTWRRRVNEPAASCADWSVAELVLLLVYERDAYRTHALMDALAEAAGTSRTIGVASRAEGTLRELTRSLADELAAILRRQADGVFDGRDAADTAGELRQMLGLAETVVKDLEARAQASRTFSPVQS